MTGYVERGEMPGLVTLVYRRGEVHIDAIGTQAFGESPAMQHDTIFRITSMTKPILAVATMILVEEGKLWLDDAVDTFLPELANRRVLKQLHGPLDETIPAARPITVRDLLTLLIGIGMIMDAAENSPILEAMNVQELGMGPPSPLRMPEPDEWIRRLGQLPLMRQPGEQWIYNTGFDVLGVLIQRVSGQSLEAFLRERIFEPLEMHDTGFSVPEASLNRLATSYRVEPETGKHVVFDEARGGQWSQPPVFPSGAGGLVSTIDDYLTFGQMMLSWGKYKEKRILSRLSVETIITDQLTSQQKASSRFVPGFFDNHGWGFGVSIITKRDDIAAVPGRYGWDGGLGTSWYSDPREEMITILMTQCVFAPPHPANVAFWNAAYQAIDD